VVSDAATAVAEGVAPDRVGEDEVAAAQARARDRRRARRARLVGRYLMLTALSLIVLFPIYVMVISSLLIAPDELTQRPPALFPSDPQWGTYTDAWTRGNFGAYLRNSFIVTGIIVTGQVVTSILAGYAFALLEFPLKRTIFVLFLATMMIPFEVTIITNLTTISDLGWLNTYQGLAVPFLALGFGAFLLRQAFLQIPRDLRDAATVDGYGHLRFLARVAVPLARPLIAALAVFSFLGAWNQYLWPLLVTSDDNLRTVQIGLEHLRSSSPRAFNVVFAGSVLAVIPLFMLLLVFQKQLIRGLTAGAVKG
jgi:sn-glycerol 3-phosphate transport system permease protein